MKVPTIDTVVRIESDIFAGSNGTYWASCYDEIGYQAWVCLNHGTWMLKEPAPVVIVDQVRSWVLENISQVRLYELANGKTERYEPNLKYGKIEELGGILKSFCPEGGRHGINLSI